MKIFINYRRDDEANIVFAIANALMREFGVENVFFDKQAIRAGSDFPEEIERALEDCRIFIPVIGKKWMQILNQKHALDEKDYVLSEVEHALDKGVIILPILIDDTLMPSEKELPPNLNRLSLINAVNISSDPKRLPLDIKLLITELNDIFSRIRKHSNLLRKDRSKKRGLKIAGWIFGVLLSVSVIAIFATTYIRNHRIEQDSSIVEEGQQDSLHSETEISEPEENQVVDMDDNNRMDQKQLEPEREVRDLQQTKVETSKAKENMVNDVDDNVYSTIIIGDQEWMAENLKVTHYANGDPIPYVSDSLQWINLETGAYCNYHNLDANGEIYGHLYNSYAIDDERGLCPAGWHVPIKAEFDILRDYLGGWKIAGGKLKETKYEHWLIPNIRANNSSGFSALPGGRRTKRGFSRMGYEGYYWSSGLYYLHLRYDDTEAGLGWNEMYDGYSIRCVKH